GGCRLPRRALLGAGDHRELAMEPREVLGANPPPLGARCRLGEWARDRLEAGPDLGDPLGVELRHRPRQEAGLEERNLALERREDLLRIGPKAAERLGQPVVTLAGSIGQAAEPGVDVEEV